MEFQQYFPFEQYPNISWYFSIILRIANIHLQTYNNRISLLFTQSRYRQALRSTRVRRTALGTNRAILRFSNQPSNGRRCSSSRRTTWLTRPWSRLTISGTLSSGTSSLPSSDWILLCPGARTLPSTGGEMSRQVSRSMILWNLWKVVEWITGWKEIPVRRRSVSWKRRRQRLDLVTVARTNMCWSRERSWNRWWWTLACFSIWILDVGSFRCITMSCSHTRSPWSWPKPRVYRQPARTTVLEEDPVILENATVSMGIRCVEILRFLGRLKFARLRR